MRKQFSALDPTHLGTDLEIQQAGLVLTCNTAGLSAHRLARGTNPMAAYISMVEAMIYGTDALSGDEYIGIATSAHSLAKYVGEESTGYGYRPYDGKVYCNGAAIATFATSAKGDLVYLILNADATTPTLTVIRNKTVLGVVSIATGGSWYPAYTLGGGTAYGKFMFCNGGQRTFQYPNTETEGWWSTPATHAPILLASKPYLTPATDSLPNLRFEAVAGRIVVDDNFVVPSGVTFWTDGSDNTVSSSVGTVDLEDPTGVYDFLLKIRNAPIAMSSVADGLSFDDALPVCNVILDRCETQGDQRKRLYLNDPIAALLDLTFQRSYFLPNTDDSVANTPRPVLIGGPRNFTPPLYKAADRAYAISDVPFGSLGILRVEGKPLVFPGSPGDFTLTADLCGVLLTADPGGTFTCEASSEAPDIPGSATDLLAGAGDFTTMTLTSQVDANWDRLAAVGGPQTPVFITTAGHGQVEFPNYAAGIYCMLGSKTSIIQNGKSYAAVMTIADFPRTSWDDSGVQGEAYFFVDGHKFMFPTDHWGPQYYSEYPTTVAGNNILAPQTVTSSFANTSGGDLPLVLNFRGGVVAGQMKLDKILLFQLPDATDDVPLKGVTLEGYMRAILSRAGWAESDWASEDARAIDAKTGYLISNYFSNTEVTVRDALAPGLNSFSAGIFRRRDGRLGVAWLIDPDSVADGDINGLIELVDIMEEVDASLDLATSLTTNAKCRRNFNPLTESDYSNQTTDPITGVPLAERKLLEMDYQIKVSSGVQLDEAYEQSELAAARATLFDERIYCQAEDDRVASIFTVARNSFDVMVSMPPDSTMEVGDVRKIYYGKIVDNQLVARYGLDGAKVLIKKIQPYPALQKALLTVWR